MAKGQERPYPAITPPRLISSWIAATSVPPVASIGSRTYTWRPERSSGMRVAYVDAWSVY